MIRRKHSHRERKALVKKFVDRKLRMRLLMFGGIIAALLVLIGFDIFTNAIDLPLALGGIVIGIVVGIFAGRMFNITWHEESGKVVSRIDKIGVVVLIAYIVFAIFRNQIFSFWVSASMLGAFGFCVIAGVMIGRVWSMGRAIWRVLHSKGIVEKK